MERSRVSLETRPFLLVILFMTVTSQSAQPVDLHLTPFESSHSHFQSRNRQLRRQVDRPALPDLQVWLVGG